MILPFDELEILLVPPVQVEPQEAGTGIAFRLLDREPPVGAVADEEAAFHSGPRAGHCGERRDDVAQRHRSAM